MPRCYSSLALAASSHPTSAENRLTEFYAVALEAHSGFAGRVFELAGLPRASTYEAFTQETLPDGAGRLDLRVYGLNDAGNVTAILFAEHKQPGGGLQEGQPDKYLPQLKRESQRTGGPGRLLLVVGAGDDVQGHLRRRARTQARREVSRAEEEIRRFEPTLRQVVVPVTWQDVANCAEIGRF